MGPLEGAVLTGPHSHHKLLSLSREVVDGGVG